jgi:hypothetical protein
MVSSQRSKHCFAWNGKAVPAQDLNPRSVRRVLEARLVRALVGDWMPRTLQAFVAQAVEQRPFRHYPLHLAQAEFRGGNARLPVRSRYS